MKREEQGVSAAVGRYQAVLRTLCFVTCDDDVLFLKGAPGKRLWANRYNGIGGHVERDEDVCAAALRELCEETGWCADDVQDLRLRALINVDAGEPYPGVLLFVFTARARHRQTRASAEGTLEWIPRPKLLDYELVEDLPALLPRILDLADDAPLLSGHYSYDQNNHLVIRFNIYHLPDAP
jgi:8-oxo-dGTP diphosphatase